jgi:predicted aconitase with swiveling domain
VSRTTILRGRSVVEGFAEGEAIVTRHAISGFGGIDSKTGEIVEVRHELRGQSFKGKVLVFPGAKGSSGWASHFQSTRLAGAGPIAMIFNKMSTKMALGAVVTRVPAVTDLDQDPIEVIKSGDWVKVDGTNGVVEITHKDQAG